MCDTTERDWILWEYFSGNADEEKCREVELWAGQSEENRQYFNRYQKNYIESRWYFRSSLIKGQYAEISGHFKSRHVGWNWTVAACLVLLLGVGGGLLFRQSFKSGSSERIGPGYNHAFLVSSTGEKIPLDTLTSESWQEINGASVTATPGGLSYQAEHIVTEELAYNTISIPRGGIYFIVLADGSKVWLNSDTELRFPVAFTGDSRTVYLKGEAFFEVKRDTCHPFIVRANEVDVRVYGTKFNVNNRSLDVIAVLESGSVGMKRMECQHMLQPEQKGVFLESGEFILEQVDTRSYTAWKDGNFVFDEETLENIMEQLSLWYDVEVFYVRDSSRQVQLSADIRRFDSIERILRYFERISEVRFKVKGKTITVE